MTARKDDILAFLKSHGPASLQQVADHLGVTKQGALRHLESLAASGLIDVRSEERGGPGRPENVYRLTAAAVDRFPASHRELASQMVHFMTPEQVESFFAQRATRLETEYGDRLRGLSLRDKVAELARLASEHGHMAEVVESPDGSLAIRQCHCPIGDVAAEVGHPCRMEMAMYSRLLGVQLQRSSYMPDDDPSCTYVVPSPPAAPTAAGQ